LSFKTNPQLLTDDKQALSRCQFQAKINQSLTRPNNATVQVYRGEIEEIYKYIALVILDAYENSLRKEEKPSFSMPGTTAQLDTCGDVVS
jgi:hypothetical protein